MFGFLNIYKPKGMTSHDVVAVIRRLTKIKQVGHTGTLDPFAEGVLPVCIGKATRLIEYLDDDKEYLATVKFGSATTTYDLEGEITYTSNTKITEENLIKELENFKGEISQIPPIYSAIKVKGKKLYEYARKGESVDIQSRKVTIEKLELKNFDYESQTAELLIVCSKGTYIRSIAHDLGKNLCCGGHLIKLVRTSAGKFKVENSVELEGLNVNENLINPVTVISLPKIELSSSEYEDILHGRQIKKNTDCVDLVILIYNNNISAVGISDKKIIKVKKVFS
ncbi:TPA: tRNA pseudouridine(55) synthase TruB [Candidatus Scatousia excrementigallinarum]|uniref:tRNA pseudouridine synthase B n=1 Tax=Candidatus Scatousia excrementigallinarum TaxID=2840935 RepID=A0A9D1EXJ9_9BACT|nr:tRNA pseudouridine(55) synthase TruB [Candidatus Scatousia excrementigallinarum]